MIVVAIVADGALQFRMFKRLDAIEGRLASAPDRRAALPDSRAGFGTKISPIGRSVPLNNAALKGSPSAKITLLEYTDFECPFCSEFARSILPLLEQEYVQTGKVQFGLKHLPLSGRHRYAREAAEAAICAGRQGQFWPMHQRLFASSPRLDELALLRAADQLKLQSSFRVCLAGGLAGSQVDSDSAEAKALGITGTPGFVLGSVDKGALTIRAQISGAKPIAEFRTILDRLLSS